MARARPPDGGNPPPLLCFPAAQQLAWSPKMISRTGRDGLDLTEGSHPPASFGSKMGLQQKQAALHLGREANSEFVVVRQGARDKILAAGLSFQEPLPIGPEYD